MGINGRRREERKDSLAGIKVCLRYNCSATQSSLVKRRKHQIVRARELQIDSI